MSFWESLALVGTAATILGVGLTVYGIINNKTLKAGFAKMDERFAKMDERFKLLALIIVEEDKQARKALIERMLSPA